MLALNFKFVSNFMITIVESHYDVNGESVLYLKVPVTVRITEISTDRDWKLFRNSEISRFLDFPRISALSRHFGFPGNFDLLKILYFGLSENFEFPEIFRFLGNFWFLENFSFPKIFRRVSQGILGFPKISSFPRIFRSLRISSFPRYFDFSNNFGLFKIFRIFQKFREFVEIFQISSKFLTPWEFRLFQEISIFPKISAFSRYSESPESFENFSRYFKFSADS